MSPGDIISKTSVARHHGNHRLLTSSVTHMKLAHESRVESARASALGAADGPEGGMRHGPMAARIEAGTGVLTLLGGQNSTIFRINRSTLRRPQAPLANGASFLFGMFTRANIASYALPAHGCPRVAHESATQQSAAVLLLDDWIRLPVFPLNNLNSMN